MTNPVGVRCISSEGNDGSVSPSGDTNPFFVRLLTNTSYQLELITFMHELRPVRLV